MAEMNETREMEQWHGSTDVLQKLPPDMVLLKMENDAMMAMAATKPRDPAKMLSEIRKRLEAYPTLAAESIYSKPVGKDDSNNQKYATGLSIRAAECLRVVFGFNRVSAALDPIPGENDKWRLTAVFSDYCNGTVTVDSTIITPWYKSRGGQMVRMNDDRFFNTEVPRQKSLREREVILRSIDPGLKTEMYELADRLMDQGLDEKKVDRIVGEFSTMGVERAHLEGLLGKTSANWSKSDQKTLVGVWQAIKDGEDTPENVFGEFGYVGKKRAPSGATSRPASDAVPGAIQIADLAPPVAVPAPEAQSAPPAPEGTSIEAVMSHLWASAAAKGLKADCNFLDGNKARPGIKIPEALAEFADSAKILWRTTGHADPLMLNPKQMVALLEAIDNLG